MPDIETNLVQVRTLITEYANRYGRTNDNIALLAVSKTKPVQDILSAAALGQRDFGESYVQEAEQKIQQLSEQNLTWHFIGPIQSNKTRKIAELFDWVHSIDRLKVAQRLSEQRSVRLPPLNLLIQVNIDNESSKSGVSASEIPGLVDQIKQLPRIRLRGLMAIPGITSELDQQREPLSRMHEAFKALQKQCPDCDTLSMGMSGDLEAAIAEGTTLVRIGTAIFGKRNN